jgi:hypothetical protein
MANTIPLIAAAFSMLLVTGAQADDYPISGRWGVTASTQKGPIHCGPLRVITFNGNQRSDSGGGVPTYRNKSVRKVGSSEFRIVDIFSTGQINSAQAFLTLKLIEPDRAELNLQPGGLLKLRKCK